MGREKTVLDCHYVSHPELVPIVVPIVVTVTVTVTSESCINLPIILI